MSTTTTTGLADQVIATLRAHEAERWAGSTPSTRWRIATLRAHEAELRGAGIRRLSLFGSVARGDAEADSDVDLAAEFDPQARMDLFRLSALERRIAEILRRRVDLLPEPVEKARLRANIERDRRLAL